MKSTYISLPLIAIGVILLAVVSSALFIVTETQQVVITEFGKPIKEIREPGLYLKKPFIQKLHYFDDRLLEWDGYPTQIPTKDKKYIWVDTFARWRIVEPLTFLQSVYNETGAQARLDDIVDSAVRNQISRYILLEAVRNSNRPMATEIIEEGEKLGTVEIENIAMGRDEITKLILKEAQELADQYGIQLVDVRIKRINYVETVRKKVYSRMIAERKRIAELYRSEGQATRMEILGKKEFKGVSTKEIELAINEIRNQIVDRDFRIIDFCHAIVVYHYKEKPSAGVMLEIRRAHEQNKPMYIFYPHERRASPLFIHIHKCGDKAVGVITFIPARFLPKNKDSISGSSFVNKNLLL